MPLTKLLVPLVALTLTVGMTTAPAQAQAQGTGLIITDVNLEDLNYDAVTGLLTATGGTVSGTFGGFPFTTDVTNFSLQHTPAAEGCAILNLELGPIDLDLLGLHVDTSPICLAITAFEGEGLLGDLLCGLAGGDLLLLPDLLDALPGILTQSLGQETGGPGPEDICDGECEILDLSVGPVDLTLLGLNVLLDDCEGGPVQVCVSASEGQGILGDLLCGLAGGGTLLDLGNLLALLDALSGLDLGDIVGTPRQIRGLVNSVAAALQDGQLSLRELNRIVDAINRLIP